VSSQLSYNISISTTEKNEVEKKMGLRSSAGTTTGRPRLSLRSPPRASPGPTISHHRASASPTQNHFFQSIPCTPTWPHPLPSRCRRRSSLLLPFPRVATARPRSCRVVLSHPLRPPRTAHRPTYIPFLAYHPTLTSEGVVSHSVVTSAHPPPRACHRDPTLVVPALVTPSAF
jgi:hypothetical protein